MGIVCAQSGGTIDEVPRSGKFPNSEWQFANANVLGEVGEGRIVPAETIIDGIDATPEAFAGVFSDNACLGKLLVKVAESD